MLDPFFLSISACTQLPSNSRPENDEFVPSKPNVSIYRRGGAAKVNNNKKKIEKKGIKIPAGVVHSSSRQLTLFFLFRYIIITPPLHPFSLQPSRVSTATKSSLKSSPAIHSTRQLIPNPMPGLATHTQSIILYRISLPVLCLTIPPITFDSLQSCELIVWHSRFKK